MAAFKSYKEGSRTDWGVRLSGDATLNKEQIKLGVLLRIADATEAMAKRHTDLIDKAERLQQSNDCLRSENLRMAFRIRALRGWVTRLKNSVARLKNNLGR